MLLDYYYFHSLDDSEKTIYKDILTAVKQRKNVVMLPFEYPDTTIIDKVFKAIVNDNPHLFYFNCNQVAKGSGIIGSGIMLDYYFDENETAELTGKVQSKINELIAGLENYSEIDKALRIYERLVENTEYDFNDGKNEQRFIRNHTIVGALLDGISVCDGISKTYKLLLNAADVNCLVVDGSSDEFKRIDGQPNHAWNIVKAGGISFHVDVTWSVNKKDKENINYDYFGLTDKRIGKDHTDFGGVPKCTNECFDYFVMNQKSISEKEDINEFLENQINIPGRIYFRLDYECNYEEEVKKIAEIVKGKVENDKTRVLVQTSGRPTQKIVIINLSIPD